MDDFKLRCVKVSGHPETKHLLQQAFQSLEDEQLSPTWFTEDECFTVKQRVKESVYIFDVFEGKAFEHIASLGNRILGPMCILTSKECNKNIPKHPRPVYNLAMKDVVACCTNMDKTQRETIQGLVEKMGGKFSKDFTEHVSHLITDVVGSSKYKVAASFNKMIMLPEWVDKVWEKSKLEPVHGQDNQFEVYRCPIFNGLTVTVSGLGSEERKEVKKLVEKEGGTYTGEMKVKECTHLIINEPKGQKYQFALKWEISVVRSEWLYGSIEKGSCQDSSQYGLQPNAESKTGRMTTSTPERQSGADGLADLSSISMISMANVNETNMITINSTAMTTMNDPNPFDDLDVTREPTDLFLDGCKIYMSGVSASVLDKLRKIINNGGATRCNRISDNVTHIVVGEKVEEDVEQIKGLASRPHMVSCQWLVECFRREQHVDESDYTSTFMPPPPPTTPDMKRTRKSARVPKAAGSETRKSSRVSKAAVTEKGLDMAGDAGEDEMQDIMSQYLGKRGDVSANDTTIAPENDETLNPASTSVTDGNETAARMEEEELTLDPDTTTALGTDGGIFQGRSFVFLGFDEETVTVMTTYVKNNGGCVTPLNARQVSDYAVVPFDGFPVDRTVKDVVTNVWLQMCIEANSLLDIASNPFFIPLEIRDGQPLTDCVMSVSGYAGTERDCLTCIISVLGGTSQDYFVRKARGKYLPSSHLIVNAPEGSKYTAAKNWGIPALGKEWLLACAKSGKREPEDLYLIDTIWEQQQKSHEETQESHDQTAQCAAQSNAGNISQCERSKKRADLRSDKDTSSKDSGTKSISKCPVGSSNRRSAIAVDNADTCRTSGAVFVADDADFSSTGNTEALMLGIAVPEGTDNCDRDKGRQSGNVSGNNRASSSVVMSLKEHDNAENVAHSIRGEKDATRTDSDSDDAMETEDVGVRQSTSAAAADNRDQRMVPGRTEGATGDGETPRFTRFVRRINQNPVPDGTPPLAMNAIERIKQMGPVRRPLGRPRETCPTATETRSEVTTGLSQKENVSTPSRTRVEELKAGMSKVTIDTPSKFMNLNVRYRPQFDTEELLAALQTPDDVRAARAKRKPSLPLDELFSPMLDTALSNMEKRKQEREVMSQQSQDEVEGEADSERSNVLRGVIISVAKKLSKDQSDLNDVVASLGGDYRWNYDKTCTHFIFQGRHNDKTKDFKVAKQDGRMIVSPHWLYKCQEENARVDEGLFPHTFNPNLSLSVVSTRRTPLRTPARNLRRNVHDNPAGDPVATSSSTVSEESVTKGDNKNKRSPKWDNPVSPKRIRLSPRGVNASTPKGDKRSSPKGDKLSSPKGDDAGNESLTSGVAMEIGGDEPEQGGSLEMREMLSRQLENVMAECKGKSKKRKSKRLNCSGTPENLSSSATRQTRRTQAESTPKTRSSRGDSEDRVEEKNSAEMAPSQSVHVVWDDPMGRKAQEKLAHKLERACSPTQEVMSLCDLDPADAQFSDTEGETELAAAASIVVPAFVDKDKVTPKMVRQQSDKTPTPEAPSLAFPTTTAAVKVTPPRPVDLEEDQPQASLPPPVFMMSGMTQAERDDYGALIEKFGGQMLDSQQYDSACTHLVINRVARNEKFLACLAAGKWVLHKSYFEACRQEQKFVKEDFYEWGSEGTLSLCKNMESNVRLLAAAAQDWRVRLQEEGKNSQGKHGAFQSWRVILCCGTGKEANYKRLLEAGGATVLNDKPPFKKKVNATHVLMELHHVPQSQSDLQKLVANGCLCLRPEYIGVYLSDPNADIFQYCPAEIKALQQT